MTMNHFCLEWSTTVPNPYSTTKHSAPKFMEQYQRGHFFAIILWQISLLFSPNWLIITLFKPKHTAQIRSTIFLCAIFPFF